jgi:preprotein translocase SecE subunit
MAVAVKHSPGVEAPSPFDRPAVVSLIGVLYLLGTLGIVFQLIPSLWWPAWESLVGGKNQIIGGSLMGLVMLAVGVGLLMGGSRLLGPKARVGILSGIFVAFVGLVLVLLLTRWVSLWVEHWVYDNGWLGENGPKTGMILTLAIGLALLVLWIWLFTRPRTQRFVNWLEAGGWFHATNYKPGQGSRVRRGTIFGILLLVGAGVYTMISHHIVGRTSPDWNLNIPFTGKATIHSMGDAQVWLAEIAAKGNTEVEVQRAGGTNLQRGQVVSPQVFKEKVLAIVGEPDFPKTSREAIQAKADGDIADFLLTVNKQVKEKIIAFLKEKLLREDVTRQMKDQAGGVDDADVGPLVNEFAKKAAALQKSNQLGPLFDLPIGQLVVDRYQLKALNARTDPSQNVKIGVMEDDRVKIQTGGREAKEGDIVPTADVDAAVEAAKAKNKDVVPPEKVTLQPAYGTTRFSSLTLLPAVQFTVPLLLMGAALWLAWRIVNMPAFADFLIATEAELNKVSWTTQRRLVQDTIVVLTTVVLMAGYLFLMDQGWRILLSSRPVGVLLIPKDDQQEKELEKKNW